MAARNFVMFSIDDLRSVDDWGHFTPLIATPNFDRLAAMGTTFERAVTPSPLCNPARTAVLSGQQPGRTGVLDNETPWFERVNPADTLPAVLKAAGVHVAMFGKHFHVNPLQPQQQNVMFDEYLAPFATSGQRSQVIEDGVWHDTPFATGRYGGSASTLPDEITAGRAVEFLRERAPGLDEPFFLGVGISKPHPSWWAPSRFFDLYDQAEIRAALQQSLRDGSIIPGDGEYFDVPNMSVPSPTHPQIRADMDLWVDYIHGYLAAVSFADAKLGQVLDALAANPRLAADTAILLWSDHGYHLGDKDAWGKFTHWREATEVPFILVDPDAAGGRTARQVVSLVDIFPTVLDVMGVPEPQRLDLEGNSLAPILQNVNVSWYDPADGKGVAMTTIYGSASVRAQVPGQGDFRYTRYPDGGEELYNITRDPNEHVNRLDPDTGAGLTAADDGIRATMGRLLDGELAKAGILISDGVRSVTGTGADETLVSTNRAGVNALAGGGGDDTYVLYRGATITEAAGGGTDLVVFRSEATSAAFRLPANVENAQVAGDFTGNDAPNRIFGGPDNNMLNGAGGNDALFGFGSGDRLDGGAGDDALLGDASGDTLIGGSGNDRLEGGSGNDALSGGSGVDALIGGSGTDAFTFAAAGDSAGAAVDRIMGFDGPGAAAGDRVNLAAIDANAGVAGNQTFQLGGTAAGRVRFVDAGANTEILGNVDGDAEAEIRVVIQDGAVVASAYVASDVVL